MKMQFSGHMYHSSNEHSDFSCVGCAFYRPGSARVCSMIDETPLDIISDTDEVKRHYSISGVCSTNRIIWIKQDNLSPDALYSKEDIVRAWTTMSIAGSANVVSLIGALENAADPELAEYIRLQKKFGDRK